MMKFQTMTSYIFLVQRSKFLRPMKAIVLLSVVFALPCGLSWANPSSTPYGGPYSIGGDSPDHPDLIEVLKKVAEFETYRKTRDIKGWDSSKVTVLSPDLFTKSIAKNKTSGVSDQQYQQFQRYNYVVQKSGDTFQILVATWSFKPWYSPWFFNLIGPDSRKVAEICGDEFIDSRYNNVELQHGAMVNFFSEDTSLPSSHPELVHLTPLNEIVFCSIDPASKGISVDSGTLPAKTAGVLDAHSKHFMLAQGEGKAFKDYPPLSPPNVPISQVMAKENRWAKESVEYAGEIIVNNDTCEYYINQGSGTYKPRAGKPLPDDELEYLSAVAKLFKDRLGSPPKFAWISPSSHFRYRTFNNTNKKLVCGFTAE